MEAPSSAARVSNEDDHDHEDEVEEEEEQEQEQEQEQDQQLYAQPLLSTVDGRLSSSLIHGEVTMTAAKGATEAMPTFANNLFEVVSYDGNHEPEPAAAATGHTVEAALSNDHRVHGTARGANFDLLLRYRPPGRFLAAGFVLRKPPASWPCPVRNVLIWSYGDGDEGEGKEEPTIAEYSCFFNQFDEGKSKVQDQLSGHFVFKKPLAYLHLQPDEDSIYVPLSEPVLVKFFHIKFLSAYNRRRRERTSPSSSPSPPPNIQVAFLGLAGLCMPLRSGESHMAEGFRFLKNLPPVMVHGNRLPLQLTTLTDEFYDYIHSHRFVYLFPSQSPIPSINGTPFQEVKRILEEVIQEQDFISDSDLTFFIGPSGYDLHLSKLCGLWNPDPTLAVIDIRHGIYHVMNNIMMTREKVTNFLRDSLAGTYPRQMQPSELERIGHLGSGGFGSVFKAVYKPTGEEVAVKVLTRSKPNEVLLLQLCHGCPQIVQCRASFKKEHSTKGSSSSIWVVMEYCGGGNAWELTDDRSFEIKEEHVATILEAVLKGLVFLEENCILHRDIKPDNILFTSDGHVKLTDLGCGRILAQGDMATSAIGHRVARSPENSYDHRTDVWSVGKTALLLARLTKLSEATSIQSVKDLKRVNFGNWDQSFVDFVQRCLQPQDLREHAVTLLEHDFIKRFAKDHTLLQNYCQTVEQAKTVHLGCIQPILSLMEQQQLHDETTNQITFILDLFSSLIKMNQDALSGLRKALESALVNQCVRIVTIGGTREGKSSLINALVGKRVCREGHLCRETKGCEWQDVTLDSQVIKIMDSRGNAEFGNESEDAIDEDLLDFHFIAERTPLQLLLDELDKDYPDVIIFVGRLMQYDQKQFQENLVFLRDVLVHLRTQYPNRPFPCVVGVASQVDQVMPLRKIEDKVSQIKEDHKLWHERMERFLKPVLNELKNIEVGTSVSLDFPLSVKLHTFPVCSLAEWSEDGSQILNDERWGIDELRKFLTESGSVRLTHGLLAVCRMQDQPQLVAKAWANFYSEVIDALLKERRRLPIPILVILKHLAICTGLLTRQSEGVIMSFLDQVSRLYFSEDLPDKPGFLYVYQGMFSWKYRLLSYSELLHRIAEALGQFIKRGYLYSTAETFGQMIKLLWSK